MTEINFCKAVDLKSFFSTSTVTDYHVKSARIHIRGGGQLCCLHFAPPLLNHRQLKKKKNEKKKKKNKKENTPGRKFFP